jgi:peptide/nickel transport system substrate-binding protein
LTTKRRFNKRALTACTVMLLGAGLAACSSSTSTGASGGSTSSTGSTSSNSNQQPLVMESSPEETLTDNFNPFDGASPIQGMGATGLVYEPLYQFDLANPSVAPYPWLATSYQWGSGGKSITFTIRQGVKWTDGQPMTAADVAFTYNYVLKYANSKTDNINFGGLPATTKVSTTGDTVTLTFPSAQYMNLEHIAGQAILPQHIWSTVADPGHFTDPKPVGTGPYTLGSFTNQGYTMVANPSYWAPVPVKKVYFPDYTSNPPAQNALFSGKIDWTGNYIPNLQQDFISKDPQHNVAFEGSNSSGAFYPNLKTGPTADLQVRKAIDVAINRQLMGTEGESGLEAPVLNASGITQPAFSAWLAPSLASNNLNPSGDPAAAATVLKADGYTKDSAGYFTKGGQELSVSIETPGSYTDFANDVELAVQSLKTAGIKASFKNVTVDAYNADAMDGNFQILLRWGQGGITPYNLYDGWLDPTLIGTGNGNYEKLNNPTMTADLAKLNGDQTIAQQTTDLTPIETYVATQLPVIPTTTSAEWCEYTSTHYTGWPTQSNPYQSCQPSGTNNGPGTGTDEYVLLHLKPA